MRRVVEGVTLHVILAPRQVGHEFKIHVEGASGAKLRRPENIGEQIITLVGRNQLIGESIQDEPERHVAGIRAHRLSDPQGDGSAGGDRRCVTYSNPVSAAPVISTAPVARCSLSLTSARYAATWATGPRLRTSRLRYGAVEKRGDRLQVVRDEVISVTPSFLNCSIRSRQRRWNSMSPTPGPRRPARVRIEVRGDGEPSRSRSCPTNSASPGCGRSGDAGELDDFVVASARSRRASCP